MCADILVGRDAFLQCIAASDKSSYDIKRKHGTRVVFFVILRYLILKSVHVATRMFLLAVGES